MLAGWNDKNGVGVGGAVWSSCGKINLISAWEQQCVQWHGWENWNVGVEGTAWEEEPVVI